jgi:hypothetical protein
MGRLVLQINSVCVLKTLLSGCTLQRRRRERERERERVFLETGTEFMNIGCTIFMLSTVTMRC